MISRLLIAASVLLAALMLSNGWVLRFAPSRYFLLESDGTQLYVTAIHSKYAPEGKVFEAIPNDVSWNYFRLPRVYGSRFMTTVEVSPLWLLVLTLAALYFSKVMRERKRKRDGLCVCGYPLPRLNANGALSVRCPECGVVAKLTDSVSGK